MGKLNKVNAPAMLDSMRAKMRAAGTFDTAAARTQMQAIFKKARVAADTARVCMRAARAGRGANGGTGGAGVAIGAPVVAFVKTATGWSPRLVRLGVSDFDYTEVISGLNVGDRVGLLATVALQASRDANSARARRFVGGALPGGSNTTSKTPARPAGGGGGR